MKSKSIQKSCFLRQRKIMIIFKFYLTKQLITDMYKNTLNILKIEFVMQEYCNRSLSTFLAQFIIIRFHCAFVDVTLLTKVHQVIDIDHGVGQWDALEDVYCGKTLILDLGKMILE